MIYNLVTLNHLREWLALPVDADMKFLQLLQSSVTSTIRNYCQREFIIKSATEDYSGSGQRILILERSPVYSNPANDNFTLMVDPERAFLSETIIDPLEYVVENRKGILRTDFPLAWGNNNIRVIYSSGVSIYTVLTGQNDTIDIFDSGGLDAIILSNGVYSSEDFLTEVLTKLNASIILNGTYSIHHSFETGIWEISCTETFSLFLGDGVNIVKSFAHLMGFPKGNNFTSETVFTSNGEIGLPDDITLAAQKLVHHWFKNSGQGEGTEHLKRKIVGGGSGGGSATLEYMREELPSDVKSLLNHYRIKHVIA